MNIETFNKPAPPNFRGLHPDLPIRTYHRHLPHWRQEGATYAVTFRQADSIPQTHLQALQRWRAIWEQQHPEPRTENEWKQFAQEITNKTDRWMDEGYGSTHVNKSLQQEGTLWEEESYDRIVRDEEHLWNVVQYIGGNPKKAGIPVAQWVRWIHPDWQAAGWDFHDD